MMFSKWLRNTAHLQIQSIPTEPLNELIKPHIGQIAQDREDEQDVACF